MRIWKSHPLLSLINSYLISAPQPHGFTNLSLQGSIGVGDVNTMQYIIELLVPYIRLFISLYLPVQQTIHNRRIGIGTSIDMTGSDSGTEDLISTLPNVIALPNQYLSLHIFLLSVIKSRLVSIILLGLFVWLLRGVGIFSRNIFNNNNFLLIILVMILFVPGVLAYETSTDWTLDHRFMAYTIIANILFLLANFFFDWFSAQYRLNQITFFNSTIITRVILGITYLLNITTGVFGTNGTWYLLDNYHTPLGAILSSIGAIIFPMIWFSIGFNNRPGISLFFNSMWRALLELVSFNCVAFCTYIYWDFWLVHVTIYPYWIAFGVFTVLLVLVGFITIYLESHVGRGRSFGYGICYWLTFTCMAMSTNSLFALISEHIYIPYVNIIVAVITALSTILLYPDIYRAGVFMTRSNLVHILLSNHEVLNQENGFTVFSIFQHLILFYLVFLSFVLYTGLFFVYIYKWLTSEKR